MKAIVFISICFSLAAILTEVHGLRKRPRPRTTRRPLHHGWRHTNGTCICQGPSPNPLNDPIGHKRPTGNHGSMGHHGPHPSGHHGHQGHHGHHSPRPSGHHGHHGPRPTGHHGHHGPRPSGHHGHHGPHPTGQHGHHGHSPHPSNGPFSRCFCRKSEMTVNINFRMMKEFSKDLNDCNSLAYRRMSTYILTKLKKVLKAKRYTKMSFSEGGVIVKVGAVYDVSQKEDPEKVLRNAIHSGEMKDMKIYPESLSMSNSYSGVRLSEWKATEDQCSRCKHHDRHRKGHRHHKDHDKRGKDDRKHDDDHHKDGRKHDGDHHKEDRKHDDDHRKPMVLQTRTCIEVDASCDGIPLTRNASCEEACYESRISICWTAMKRHKYIVITCLAVALVLIIVIVVMVVKVKKSRKKYMKTSPSTSSIKELAKNDELQKELQFNSKC